MSLQGGNADGTLAVLKFLNHRQLIARQPLHATPRSTGLKCDFTRSDSSIREDGPKERVVPPFPKEPTNSLRIDRFFRAFTLKAVQELLGKTGNVTSFWMDNIKTLLCISG